MTSRLWAALAPSSTASVRARELLASRVTPDWVTRETPLSTHRVLFACGPRTTGRGSARIAHDAASGITLLCDGWFERLDETRIGAESVGRTDCGDDNAAMLLRQYARCGDRLVDDLNGQFSLMVADPGSDQLLLFADPFCTHPLYYRVVDRVHYVANSVRALATIHPSPEVRGDAFLELLARQGVRAPRTLFDGVQAVEPGTVQRLGGRSRRYWTWRYAPEPMVVEDALELVGTALDAATRLGVLGQPSCFVALSGGIDSSLVASSLRGHGCRFTPTTLAVDWVGREMDETTKARIVASSLGAELVVAGVSATSFPTLLQAHLRAADQPCPLGFGISLLSQAVEGSAELGLSGLGSDEFFFGYPEVNARLFGFAIPSLVDRYMQLSSLFPRHVLERVADRMGIEYGPVEDRIRERMLGDIRERGATTPEEAAAVVLIDGFLVPGDVYSYHLFAAGHGVDVRHPFLNRRVVEVARRIPTALAAFGAGRVGKPLLRRLARRRALPRSIWVAPKHGFGAPAMAMVSRSGQRCRWFRYPARRHELSRLLGDERIFGDPVSTAREGALDSYRLWARLLTSHWLDEISCDGRT